MRPSKDEDTPWRDYDTFYDLFCVQELSVDEMSQIWGIRNRSIRNWRDRHGIDPRGVPGKKGEYAEEEVLRRLYCDEGLSCKEIADKYGKQPGTIDRWLLEYDLRDREERGYPRPRKGVLREMRLRDEKTDSAIADEFGVSESKVVDWMRHYDIPPRPDDRAGMEGVGKRQCHDCGYWYKNVGSHHSLSSCSWQDIDQRSVEIIEGMLMGDGYITNVGGGTAAFCANMTNKTFLDWLYSELSPHSSSVRLAQSAEDSAKSNRDNGYNPDAKVENYRDIYSYRMITHPKINEIYERWYSGGDKVYPSDLELTPMKAKMWYVGDGGLNWGADSRRPSVGIAAVNEEDRNDNTRRMFRDAGFDPSVDGRYIRFNQSDTKRFLDWMGEPPDGFEYKWEQGSRDRYLDLKEEAYMNGELPLEKRRDTQGVGVLEDW